ncbi:MAG: allantoinase AllB [Symbiobacteriaceae bacterium]|nr:allantoinase AllB [Symbiobacteriaceae bacterium]
MFDLLIRGGQVVLPEQTIVSDIGISQGKIVALGENLGSAAQVIAAQGMVVFPGLVDAHVHISEPGRTHWEGYVTATKAAAKGGVTTIIEMPQNQLPACVDAATLQTKFAAGTGKLWVDIASLGALSDQSLSGLAEMAGLGVVGYKCFMSPCGVADEPSDQHGIDDYQLLRGMEIIASLGKVLMVHAENGVLNEGYTGEMRRQGRNDMAAFLAARPLFAEVEAVRRVIYLGRITGCRLHLVHLSSIEAVREVVAAREEGQDVSCEIGPHFLIFDSDDLLRLGAVLKSSPPLRERRQRDALWQAAISGEVDFIASDHSPCPPEMKERPGLDAWGGTAALQTSLEMLYSEAVVRRGLSQQWLAAMLAANPAKRFDLEDVGEIRLGGRADLVLLAPTPYTLTAEDLEYRHKQSPYLGMTSEVRVHSTILRGQLVYSCVTGFSHEPLGAFR